MALNIQEIRPNNYFRKELFVLKVLGLSVSGNESIAYRIYSFVLLFGTVFVYCILDFCELFKHSFEEDSDIVVYDTAGFMMLTKTAVLLQNRIKFGKLLAKLEQEPFAPNAERGGEVEDQLIKECLWITRIQTITYWTVGGSCLFSSALYPFIVRLTSNDYHDWKFSYGLFTLMNVTYSPNYEITWLYQNISVATVGTVFTSSDLLLAAVLAHISYQFKMVQNCIRRIVKAAHKEMTKDGVENKSSGKEVVDSDIDGSKIPWKYLQKSLSRAVSYHSAVIDMAHNVEEIFRYMLLLVFLGTLALLCVLIFNASMGGESPETIRYVGEALCAILQVLTVCYWGEQVMYESQQVAQAVFEINFIGTDTRFQKDLAFIVRRSQNPTKLTAGKFSVICLTTFMWILRTSYSAFMVLQKNNSGKI